MSTAAACKEYFARWTPCRSHTNVRTCLETKSRCAYVATCAPKCGRHSRVCTTTSTAFGSARSPKSLLLPPLFTPVEKASSEIVAAGEIFSVVGIQTYNIWIAAIWLLFQSFLKVNTTFKQINKH